MTAGAFLRRSLFARSFLLQAGFGDERRQGLGFAFALDPALRLAYAGDSAGLAAARLRHLEPFNAQPYAAALPLGAAAALELRAAAGEPALAARAVALKSSLGAALSGSADAFFWGALRPLAGGVAVGVAVLFWRLRLAHPCATGVAAGLLTFNVPAVAARLAGVSRGLDGGEAAALDAARLPVQAWIRGVRRGAVAAIVATAWLALGHPEIPLHASAAVAFAAGAGLSRFTGGPLRLLAAAFAAGAVASLAGWTL
ncbi:MAG: PTS system mannose/fructose/sorbose family transporter subunit IID [Elusimicrobia bacterium]|nr:PTS system mannose/fructose/sorbose family transporter subunit IID [Elusimicrobiota bacterium]